MKPNSCRAALSLALPFLARRDVTRFVVSALEGGHVAVALWLLYGDAYPLIIDEIQCLRVAAAEGCWVAMAALLRKLAYDQQGRIVNTPQHETAFDTAVAVHQAVVQVFPPSVMYRAVARGDLQQIKWLHTTTQYGMMEAVERAAEERQIHVVQWLLDHVRTGELLQCWLRYEDSPVDVRAIGWISQTDAQVHFCGLSEAHGFTRRTQLLWEPDARISDLPLAEPFAAAGDRVSLQKLLQLNDAECVVSRYTFVQAARGGHLDVVQWLHSLSLHEWPLATAMVEAAANGRFEVVQWLYQFIDARVSDTINRALEGGHLLVARWLREQDSPLFYMSDFMVWSAAARSMKLSVYRLLHEDWGSALDGTMIMFMGLAGDRALMEYVVEQLLPVGHVGETLVFGAAKKGTIDALEYLVDVKGFWSRKALRAAVGRPKVGLALSHWIYEAAKQRARQLDTALEMLLDFSDINVLIIAREAGLDTALWLVENVPEVSTDNLLGAEAFAPESCSHTCTDVVFPHLSGDDAAAVDALLIACLKYRPHLCTAIQWLPHWAVRANSSEGYDLLADINHPQLFTQATCDCILTFSRRAYFMNKLLAHDGVSLYSPRVRAWATKYQLQVPLIEDVATH